uniref:Uncharacterized protein n=1 Tax=Rhizophora mucronata TaxID=61149 RepID=A0A2P2P6B2_RHIMU
MVLTIIHSFLLLGYQHQIQKFAGLNLWILLDLIKLLLNLNIVLKLLKTGTHLVIRRGSKETLREQIFSR